eukprot:366130-Chlamydomonas_euryale.AAC.23
MAFCPAFKACRWLSDSWNALPCIQGGDSAPETETAPKAVSTTTDAATRTWRALLPLLLVMVVLLYYASRS